jgi:hypothetical protein
VFQAKDGDVEHNAAVAKRVETARYIFNGQMKVDELARAALWAAAAPEVLSNSIALAAENKNLKAEIEALKQGEPGLETGSGDDRSTEDDDKQYEGMTMGQVIARKASKAGGWS